MMDFDMLSKRVQHLAAEIKEVSTAIEEMNAEFEGNGSFFEQSKEIENTIQNLQKRHVPVPSELQQLKLSLVHQCERLEQAQRIDEAFFRLADLFPKGDKSKQVSSAPRKNPSAYTPSEYTGTRLQGIKLFGHTHSANHWRDLIPFVCQVMAERHPDEFSKILQLRGRKRPYVSSDPEELRIAAEVEGTGVYCETHCSASSAVSIAKKVLKLFGHGPDVLEVIYEVS